MTTLASVPAFQLNTWIPSSWDEFVSLAEEPTYAKLKGYYYQGRMRFEPMSTGADHSKDHTIIILAIGLYAMVRQIPLNTHDACSYRKTGHDECQPDASCYIGQNATAIPYGTRVIDLDRYPLPDLVIEVSDTTLGDDKGEKRLQYEDLRIPEYWIVNVQTGEILAWEIAPDGSSRRIQTSQVLARLDLGLLTETLKRSRQENQSVTLAWLMTQFG